MGLASGRLNSPPLPREPIAAREYAAGESDRGTVPAVKP